MATLQWVCVCMLGLGAAAQEVELIIRVYEKSHSPGPRDNTEVCSSWAKVSPCGRGQSVRATWIGHRSQDSKDICCKASRPSTSNPSTQIT